MFKDFASEINQLHAGICSALADPKRILILYTLAERTYTVNDLVRKVGFSQPTTSRHLKVLRMSGLVTAIRRGSNVEYSLKDHRLIEALDLLRDILHDKLAHQADLVSDKNNND
ncbi:MAG TPA: winged helix-turn-helix transcriptional regulator [Anaerolineae bacterium]|nr:winged helix-turn-helix transcriptional regulator [Anaerolineae bacterium]